MSERSIFSGKTPRVVIRSGGDVVVKSWDSDRVKAESDQAAGLQVRRKKGTIEVEIEGSGSLLVPFDSSVKVYAAKSAEIRAVHGAISAYAGNDIHIAQSLLLAQASAGRALVVDCQTAEGPELRLTAGGDLRCRFQDLKNVQYRVDDQSGIWDSIVGDGSTVVHLKAGGAVTLLTGETTAIEKDHPPTARPS